MLLPLQVLRTSSALEAAARRAFKKHGISPAQFNVLNIVSDHNDGVSSIHVAEQLLVDRSNITGLVKGLVNDRLLEITPSPSDKRVKLLRLTREGRGIWKKTNEVYQEGLSQVTDAISSDEKTIKAGLEKIEEIANELFR